MQDRYRLQRQTPEHPEWRCTDGNCPLGCVFESAFGSTDFREDDPYGPPQVWENQLEIATEPLRQCGSPALLDRSEAFAILGPYSEIWQRWSSKADEMDEWGTVYIDVEDGRERLCLTNGDFWAVCEWYEAKYLQDVAGQYRHLTEGPGDPLPSAEDQVLMLRRLQDDPELARRRSEFLNDPFERALYRHSIHKYYEVASEYMWPSMDC